MSMHDPHTGDVPPPPQWPDAPPPPLATKPKARRAPWIVGGIIALVLIVCGGCLSFTALNGTGNDPKATPSSSTTGSPVPTLSPPQRGGQLVIVYEVTGAGSGQNITYNADGGASIAQVAKAPLPWRKEIKLADKGYTVLAVTAQRSSGGGGTITCRISVNGKVVKETTSEGGYAVVSCSGNWPE